MITAADFHRLVDMLGEQAREDIAWAESCAPPATPDDFAREAIWVICCSGMKYYVARLIERRVTEALLEGKSANTVFFHKGKAAAMDHIWANRAGLYREYMTSPNQLEFLAGLPWIGEKTKFQLAKNFGLGDFAKPDVHLQRLADREGVTAQQLCERLAGETGFKVATVDTILWRACATGVLNSRTGAIREAA